MGTSHDEFATLVEGVGRREEVAALELNVSCPNVKSGLIVGESPEEARSLLSAMKPLTEKPLIVKLTPNVADPVPVAVAAEEGGADAVSLINTLRPALRPGEGERWLGGGTGGLSGPAVRAVALAQVSCGGRRGLGPGGGDGRCLERRGTPPRCSAPVHARCRRDGELPRPGRRVQDRRRAGRGAGTDIRLDGGFFRQTPKRAFPLNRDRGYTAAPMQAPVQSSNAAPERSLDQRMEALRRANDIRSKRAQLKRDLKGNKVKIQTLLMDPPEYVQTAKVIDMLMAVPKYGRVKTNRILNQCRISPSKTIGGLSERQRAELVAQLRK